MLVLKRKEFASVLIPPKILGGVPEVKTVTTNKPLFGGINNTQIRGGSNRVSSPLSNLVGQKLDRNFSKLESIALPLPPKYEKIAQIKDPNPVNSVAHKLGHVAGVAKPFEPQPRSEKEEVVRHTPKITPHMKGALLAGIMGPINNPIEERSLGFNQWDTTSTAPSNVKMNYK